MSKIYRINPKQWTTVQMNRHGTIRNHLTGRRYQVIHIKKNGAYKPKVLTMKNYRKLR